MISDGLMSERFGRLRSRLASEGLSRVVWRVFRHLSKRIANAFLLVRRDIIVYKPTGTRPIGACDDAVELEMVGPERWEEALAIGPAEWRATTATLMEEGDVCILGKLGTRVIACMWGTGRVQLPSVLAPNCPQADSACMLYGLYVVPDLRGRGIGARFIEYAGAHLHSRGFSGIWGKVNPRNAPAIHCYRKIGWPVVGWQLRVFALGWCVYSRITKSESRERVSRDRGSARAEL